MARIVGLTSCVSLPRYRGWDFQNRDLGDARGRAAAGRFSPLQAVSPQSLLAGLGWLSGAEIHAGKKSSSPRLMGRDMGHLVEREINS